MSRKKKDTTSNDSDTANVATMAAGEEPGAHTAGSQPDWIDGAPVTEEGQFIREGSPRPSPQMQLSDPGETDAASEYQTDGEPGRTWGNPYKSIFSCSEMGFELGENRRYKQRVFIFTEKPSTEILDALKAHGFVYRAGEKAWTINASAESRKLTDDLARQWAGPNYQVGIER